MKHRLMTILFLPLLIGFSRAQTLTLQVNTTKLDINNNLSLTIALDDPEDKAGGEVDVQGINGNFDVVGQARSTNTQIINGQVSSVTQLRLDLRAKKAGNYTIGPATIPTGTGTLTSNQINVEVTGERTFLNGTPQGLGQTQDADPINNNIQINTLDADSQPDRNFGLFVIILLAFAGLCYGAYKKLMRLDIKSEDFVANNEKQTRNIVATTDDLPRSDAHDFIEKADQIMKDYVWLKSGEETKYLSYEEIKTLTKDFEKPEKRDDLLAGFEKAKYSPELVDNKEIKQLMKELIV